MTLKPTFLIINITLTIMSLGQINFQGIQTVWSGQDAWKSWRISTNSGQGSLGTVWTNNPTSWNFEIGNINGKIQQKWSGSDNSWEVITNNLDVSIDQQWSNDWHSWEIKTNNGKFDFVIHTIWSGQDAWKSWEMTSMNQGNLKIKTVWSDDSAWQSWDIEDHMEQVPAAVKMAAIFIVIYNSLKINGQLPQ